MNAIAENTCNEKTTAFKQYKIALEQENQHRFNENQIRSFVYYWFGLHDKHEKIEKSYELLDEKSLFMQYPEITVRSKKDYKTWYDNVGKNIKNNRHIIKELEVKMLAKHQYQINLVVNWQAIDKDNHFINVQARQSWLLIDGHSKSHPYIKRYQVLSFKDE